MAMRKINVLYFWFLTQTMQPTALSFNSIVWRSSHTRTANCIQKRTRPTQSIKFVHFSSLGSGDNEERGQNDTVRVTFETSGKSNKLTVPKGELLRTALIKAGVSPHNGRARLINCRGLGTCGTCAVEITSDCDDCDNCDNSNNSNDAVKPNQRNTKERMRLNFPPHGSAEQSPNLRLACQVQVQDDITVRKRTGFWGQNTDDLAEEYESELWFGELEFILDDKSPRSKK